MQSSEKDGGPEKISARLLELAEEIFDLTTRQTEAIRSEDWDGLRAILDEKDRRIHQFQETEKFMKRWQPLRGMTEPVPSLKGVLSRIESRLVAIQTMEEECRRCLIDRKNQTARTLREIREAHEGVKRFKSRRVGAPRFVDLRK